MTGKRAPNQVRKGVSAYQAQNRAETLNQTHAQGNDHMVARVRQTRVNVESASAPVGIQRTDPKAKQAWKYPGGNVERMPIWVNGTRYHDHIDTSLGRRKQESTMFLTVNTNKAGTTLEELQVLQEALETVLAILGQPDVMPLWFKYGPVHPEVYGNDKWNDVVREPPSYEAKVEVGPEKKRVHGHIFLTVVHYSQIQIWVQMMQQLVRSKFNQYVAVHAPHLPDLKIEGMPFIFVKRMPQRMWNDIMRGYLRKGMQLTGDASDKMADMDNVSRMFSK